MKSNADSKADNRSTIGGPSRSEGEPANEFTAKLAAEQEPGGGHALQPKQSA